MTDHQKPPPTASRSQRPHFPQPPSRSPGTSSRHYGLTPNPNPTRHTNLHDFSNFYAAYQEFCDRGGIASEDSDYISNVPDSQNIEEDAMQNNDSEELYAFLQKQTKQTKKASTPNQQKSVAAPSKRSPGNIKPLLSPPPSQG
mgnify:CR=1 FL=1